MSTALEERTSIPFHVEVVPIILYLRHSRSYFFTTVPDNIQFSILLRVFKLFPVICRYLSTSYTLRIRPFSFSDFRHFFTRAYNVFEPTAFLFHSTVTSHCCSAMHLEWCAVNKVL